MTTKRDLAEARAFDRRRLVAAFLSGAPAGPQVAPVRTGRLALGSLVLGVMLVIGAAADGALNGHIGAHSNDPGPVSSRKDQGGPGRSLPPRRTSR
jgi:hypothetical protein